MRVAAELVRRFLAWWAAELRACLPSVLVRLLGRRRKILLLALQEDRLTIRLRRGDRWRELGAVALRSDRTAEAAEPLRRLLRAAGRAEVAVALPPHKVLRRLVQLPAAALENLREVLAFEMDRHTPFKAEEVAFDYRLAANDPGAQRIGVDLAVAQRSAVEEAAALARALGCVPRLVCAGAADLDAPRPMNLLAAEAGETAASASRSSVFLLVVALLLAATAIYLPLHFKRELLATYEASLAESRAAALAADALAKRVSEAQQRESFLAARKRARPSVTAIINELSLRLPQHTWLVQLTLHDRRIEFSGYSPRASTLIAEIEPSSMLAEVEFDAPVVKDPELGLEKFQLSATVAAEAGE